MQKSGLKNTTQICSVITVNLPKLIFTLKRKSFVLITNICDLSKLEFMRLLNYLMASKHTEIVI